MKSLYVFFFLFLVLGKNVGAQMAIKEPVSDFEISIDHSSSGVFTLLCNKGCAWQKLSFKDDNPERVYHINDLGMDEDTGNVHFNFSIQYRKKEIILNATRGTAWKKLSFSYPKGKRKQIIDRYGMK